MQTYIYNKNLEILETLNYKLEEFKKEPSKYYPDFDSKNMILAETRFNYPILDNGIIREKTEEELKIEGIIDLGEWEYIEDNKVKTIEIPDNLLKPIREGNVAVEGATEEELKEKYFSIINEYKQIILAQGFEVEISEIAHKQKARDKDVALLTSSIMSLGLLPKEHQVINWAFSDNDITNLTLENLKSMLIKGTVFINQVYSAEHTLKMRKPNLNLTIQNFINLL